MVGALLRCLYASIRERRSSDFKHHFPGRGALFMRAMILTSILGAALSSLAFARDPLGERAPYALDHDRARTSSVVRSGTMSVSVDSVNLDDQARPLYKAVISYDFHVTLVGDQQGTQSLTAYEDFFAEDFLELLRANGHYESPTFKMDYLRQETVRTLDGRVYPNAYIVRIYDIVTEPGDGDLNIAEIENLVVVAAMVPNVPAIGAAKLDITGRYNGLNIKAGSDYAGH